MSYTDNERRQHPDSDAYFNSQFSAKPVMVMPGQAAWTKNTDEMLVAQAGEGVVMSLYDTELKMAAMGYVLLPKHVEEAFPYFKDFDRSHIAKALDPVEQAIGLMKQNGAGKARLSLRLYGASAFEPVKEHRGLKHLVFVHEYLSRKGLGILNEDIGGSSIRRIHFLPESGRSVSMLLKRQSDYERLAGEEKHFQAEYSN